MRLLRWLGELLWPNDTCPICGKAAAGGSFVGNIRLCADCAAVREMVCCPKCAAFHRAGEGHHCLPVGFDVVAFAPYGGDVRLRLRDLKYHGQQRMARPLGRLAAAAWLASGFAADCIVPVPLYAGRQKDRGYNQSELLAEVIGREVGLAVFARALVRTRDTDAQHRLSAAERRQNVSGAFVGGMDIGEVVGRRVLLVDDIITTGATMQSCAEVLLDAGAVEVLGLAVAGKRLGF